MTAGVSVQVSFRRYAVRDGAYVWSPIVGYNEVYEVAVTKYTAKDIASLEAEIA